MGGSGPGVRFEDSKQVSAAAVREGEGMRYGRVRVMWKEWVIKEI